MNKRQLGSIQVAIGAAFWSFGGVFCKWIPWDGLTIHGLRAFFGVLFLGLLRRSFAVKISKGNLLGALGASATSILYIVSTKLTSAANAIVLQYAMPVVVIAFCWIFYRQKPSRSNVITAAFIMLGVVLCSVEGMSGGNIVGDMLALLSAVTFALVFFCSRLPNTSAKDYSFLGLLASIPFALFALRDPAMSLEPTHWLAIAAMGACLAGGYFFVSLGMSNTSPVSAALLSNLEPILNPVWVFLFLGEAPGAWTLVGSVIVLVSATAYSILGNKGNE